MTRLAALTKDCVARQHKLLIPYLVAGDPDLGTSARLLHLLVEQGADVIELGIPFSDPSADGPVIQRGVERALANRTALTDVLALVAEFRRSNQHTPLVLMGYLNPIESMGYDRFAEAARGAGVDGVLVVDMPPAESDQLQSLLRAGGIDTIYLVAPTTSADRVRMIMQYCSGYLYYVSLKGVTGAALTDPDAVRENIARLRGLTDLPVVVGFGIKDEASAQAMAALADGVIIGSALVERIAQLQATPEPSQAQLLEATALIARVRAALDETSRSGRVINEGESQ